MGIAVAVDRTVGCGCGGFGSGWVIASPLAAP